MRIFSGLPYIALGYGSAFCSFKSSIEKYLFTIPILDIPVYLKTRITSEINTTYVANGNREVLKFNKNLYRFLAEKGYGFISYSYKEGNNTWEQRQLTLPFIEKVFKNKNKDFGLDNGLIYIFEDIDGEIVDIGYIEDVAKWHLNIGCEIIETSFIDYFSNKDDKPESNRRRFSYGVKFDKHGNKHYVCLSNRGIIPFRRGDLIFHEHLTIERINMILGLNYTNLDEVMFKMRGTAVISNSDEALMAISNITEYLS